MTKYTTIKSGIKLRIPTKYNAIQVLSYIGQIVVTLAGQIFETWARLGQTIESWVMLGRMVAYLHQRVELSKRDISSACS